MFKFCKMIKKQKIFLGVLYTPKEKYKMKVPIVTTRVNPFIRLQNSFSKEGNIANHAISRLKNQGYSHIYERQFGQIVGNKVAVSGRNKAGNTKTYLLTSHRFTGKKTIDRIKSSAENGIKVIKKSLFGQFGNEISQKSKELLYLNSKLADVSESASGWIALKPKNK